MSKMESFTETIVNSVADLGREKNPEARREVSPRRRGLREASAVLHCFEPHRLIPYGCIDDDAGLGAFLADDVMKAAGASGKGWYTLKPEVRSTALGNLLRREEIASALMANPDRLMTPVQRTFEDWMSGAFTSKELGTFSLDQLRNTVQIVAWFGPDVPPHFPDDEALARCIDWTELFAEFDHLYGHGFFGRDKELKLLSDFVGVVPAKFLTRLSRVVRQAREYIVGDVPPPLVIHGPGGIGKSSLIGRFLREHVGYAHTRRFPFVYFGFDNPSLRISEPVTIIVEALTQLERQFGRSHPLIEEFRTQLNYTRDSRAFESERSGNANLSMGLSVRLNEADDRIFSSFAQLLTGLVQMVQIESGAFSSYSALWSAEEFRPVVLFFDAFEEVQFRESAFLLAFSNFLTILQRNVPYIRIIIAGRAEVSNIEVNGKTPTNYELKSLPPVSAASLVKSITSLPESVCSRLVETFHGMPLVLRLLSRLVVKEIEESSIDEVVNSILNDGAYLHFSGNDAAIAYLYGRVLDHIHDADVRALAHPGMTLRYVTRVMIKSVLAGPCGVDAGTSDRVDALFDSLKAEHSLVSTRDHETLVFRPEVRKPMLQLLAHDKPQQVRHLHRAAADYFMTQSDPVSRAELVYHLMMLGEPSGVLEQHWQSSMSSALQDVMDEVPLHAAAWLATHLGLVLDDKLQKAADTTDLERAAGRQALHAIRNGESGLALKILRQSYPFLPGSALHVLLARLLAETEKYSTAIDVAQHGLRTMTSAVNLGRFVELCMVEAICQGRLGDLKRAMRSLHLAESRARNMEDRLCLTHILTVRALSEMGGDTSCVADISKELIAELADCLHSQNDDQFDRHRALLAWSAALVAEDFPEIAARAFDAIGDDALSRLTSPPALSVYKKSPSREAQKSRGNRQIASHYSQDVIRRHAAGAPRSDSKRIPDIQITAAIVLNSKPLWTPQDVPGLDVYREEWELQTTQAVMG